MRIAASSLLLPLLLAGCVIATPEREGLPIGVTLLDSDDGYCEGPIQIGGDPDVIVDDGESTVVAVVDEDDIEWQCLSGYSRDAGEFDCPDGTSYVRVSRDDDEADFTLECFGA